ncbi:hypothetical protein B0A49_00425 [Cryomyces minteri]|uniref:RING-type domain-containing protein n=1 Tax=Cryomyces minteri TaxID=331657 RepID=A0A4U0XWJ1_9PEZI|nr:hypothetical protein B0A49_00425 [Cryomyces minteri]
MRPLRLVLSLTSCIVAITLLLYVAVSAHGTPSKPAPAKRKSRFNILFSFHTPSSLFPPSATISLTDDNSTFFLARPAAFGPLLPTKGLSGQLWIGSGFGDDSLGHGGLAAGAEGELGCSDVLGWSDGDGKPAASLEVGKSSKRKSASGAKSDNSGAEAKPGKRKRGSLMDESNDESPTANMVANSKEDDGTDDHLHHPLPTSGIATPSMQGSSKDKLQPAHADIQSIQESAEIAGKVVLLSRGGCGFLEKVKWVQRRGGVALIVGDDIRGGPLVTMYARGDTSNVSIPALFTSHTTAHLLSSLIPSGGYLEDISPDDAAKMGIVKHSSTATTNQKVRFNKQNTADRPTFTEITATSKPTATSRVDSKQAPKKFPASASTGNVKSKKEHKGWLRSLFGGEDLSGTEDSRRPPSSGHLDWVLLEEWNGDEALNPKLKSDKETNKPKKTKSGVGKSSGDGFVIGVQDWRDPDLVGSAGKSQADAKSAKSSSAKPGHKAGDNLPKGGSITPGSGEYEKPSNQVEDLVPNDKASSDPNKGKESSDDESGSWLEHMKWSGEEAEDEEEDVSVPSPGKSGAKTSIPVLRPPTLQPLKDQKDGEDSPTPDNHEGLWVTLTPTSISSSPFFDTLLVLVVSPLVTLTIVYALLLIRSRIRRRRWRAPKSVVERLPVRTYHTLSSTNSSSTSPLATPVATSPTTPLLAGPRTSSAGHPRSRPRSRTASEVPAQTSSSLHFGDTPSTSLDQVQEKREAGLAEWRRRYGGKQKECVVCLEEYVDGVSRVMSLPCGHEFHAECITPWLTTRHRTCPICKGDVVRSMARGGASSQSLPYRDDEDEEAVQTQAAENRNDSPSSAIPISTAEDDFEDLEAGVDRTR